MEAETVPVSFVATNARAVDSKALFALVDVEMQVAGVAFSISASKPGVSLMATPPFGFRLSRMPMALGKRLSKCRTRSAALSLPPCLPSSWTRASPNGASSHLRMLLRTKL